MTGKEIFKAFEELFVPKSIKDFIIVTSQKNQEVLEDALEQDMLKTHGLMGRMLIDVVQDLEEGVFSAKVSLEEMTYFTGFGGLKFLLKAVMRDNPELVGVEIVFNGAVLRDKDLSKFLAYVLK